MKTRTGRGRSPYYDREKEERKQRKRARKFRRMIGATEDEMAEAGRAVKELLRRPNER